VVSLVIIAGGFATRDLHGVPSQSPDRPGYHCWIHHRNQCRRRYRRRKESARDLLRIAALVAMQKRGGQFVHHRTHVRVYAAGRLTYGANGDPVSWKASIKAMMQRATRRKQCWFSRRFNMLTINESKGLECERVGDNGRVALVRVRVIDAGW